MKAQSWALLGTLTRATQVVWPASSSAKYPEWWRQLVMVQVAGSTALFLSRWFRDAAADSSLNRSGRWCEGAPSPPWVCVSLRPWAAGPWLPAPHVLHMSGRSSARSPVGVSAPSVSRVVGAGAPEGVRIQSPSISGPSGSALRPPGPGALAPGDPLTKSASAGHTLQCDPRWDLGVSAALGRWRACLFACRVLIGSRRAVRRPLPRHNSWGGAHAAPPPLCRFAPPTFAEGVGGRRCC